MPVELKERGSLLQKLSEILSFLKSLKNYDRTVCNPTVVATTGSYTVDAGSPKRISFLANSSDCEFQREAVPATFTWEGVTTSSIDVDGTLYVLVVCE